MPFVVSAATVLGAARMPIVQSEPVTIETRDEARDRNVTAKFCHPAGDGPWPLLAFAHGSFCAPEDYKYFCEIAATVSVFHEEWPPDVEGLAADQAFWVNKLPELYPGKISGPKVLGGHSMGGGCALRAAGGLEPPVTSPADGMVVFAPGMYHNETDFIQNIIMPALVVVGGMDCGGNALDKMAQRAFDGIGSETKVLVVPKGANHCQWTEPSPDATQGVCVNSTECHGIEPAEQQRIGVNLMQAFMDGLGSDDAWAAFEGMLAAGEASGTWAYLSSRTFVPGKTLSNDCPCDGSTIIA